MVSLKNLYELDHLEFVAGRNMLLHGVQYKVGDMVDKDVVRGTHNRESLLRSNRTIPVVTDLNDVPRAYQRYVKDRALTFRKLNRVDDAGYDVTDKTVATIKADLAGRPYVSSWAYALLDEVTGANRVTLVSFVKAGNDDVPAEDIELFVSDEDNYADGEALEDFDFATDPDLAYPAEG